MSTNTKQIPISILVRPYNAGYIGICKETGVIREADSFEEAKKAIFSATFALLEAIEADSTVEPSLKLGLSPRMRVFYEWSLVMILFLHMRNKLIDSFFTQGSASDLRGYCPA